jgi:hypothetical protein
MLEVDLQDIPVGEDFFQSVMASLPKDPPPVSSAKDKKKTRNGMRLAALAGLIGTGLAFTARAAWFQGRTGLFSFLPATDLEGAGSNFESLFDVARTVLVALEGIAGGIGLNSTLSTGHFGLIGGAAAAVLLVLGTGSALLAVAARCWLWPNR